MPLTYVVGSNAIFNWTSPVSNGSPITGYYIYIRRSDLTFVIDTAICNGLNATVIQNTQCIVPLSVLTSSPYNLLTGYSIVIQVVAINAYGNSSISIAGSGGLIQVVPDAPINVVNNVLITTNSVISFNWTNGLSNGGSSIIDYRITYDQSTGNYVTLASGVLTQYYTTSITIIEGQTYSFMIEARNSVGYSIKS